MKGKTITALVVVCFILLAFSPMSSNAEENLQSVLVEVNGEKYPVELSEEDLATIDQIVFSLQNQLQGVKDKEQATQHLQEALTALDNLGIVQGISVEHLTQQIMRGVLITDNKNSGFQNQLSKDDSTINAMCSLIIGNFSVSSHDSSFRASSAAVRIIFFPLMLITAPFAFIAALYQSETAMAVIFRLIFSYSAGLSLSGMNIETGLLFPTLNIHTISSLTFGYEQINYKQTKGGAYLPSGLITSIGLTKQTINGQIKGNLPQHFRYIIYPGLYAYFYAGICGFTGISIRFGDNYNIIGSGLRTRLVEV